MNTYGIIKLVSIAGLLFSAHSHAATALEYFTADEKYTGPSVEDNVTAMDTDKNGFADASEVRAFLELKHGKGYEKDLLEKFEASVKGSSCGTPFANKLYVSN